ncbi:MAG: TrkH family potassium uptake protein [Salinirussus sp.]
MVRVDWRASLSLVGSVLTYLSLPLLIPLGVAVFYGDDVVAFGATLAVAVLAGFALGQLDDDPDIAAREGFLVVGVTWLAVALLGTLPYVIAGAGTASTLANPVNALFESMSGFTTTGATVMGQIGFERHSHALLLWRQLTQWLGGMGIVVLAVAILPELSVGGAQLMDAEAPGPGIEKLTPRIAETARVLWLVYLGFTVLEFLLLSGLHLAGLAPNMGPFNAVSHALTTLPTGGFSPEARSIEAFSAAVQWVILPFMVVAGTNFALFWRALSDDPLALFRDTEWRYYAGVLGVVTALLAGLLFGGLGVGLAETPANVDPIPGQAEDSLRHGAFQAVSIVTTTGYASTDFNTWSDAAKSVLLVGFFLGGSAGSTGGAIKMIRTLVILKTVRRELFTAVHPDAVSPIRLGGRALDERAVRGILAFTLLYLVVFFLGVALVAIDSSRASEPVPLLDVVSAVAATLGNVGPGFGVVGPMNSYLPFPDTSKLLMVFLMWAGRLEIIPVFVLLTGGYWRS